MNTPDDISGPWLEIDLDAVSHNFKEIASIADNLPLMPVIKANAYGHGLEQIGIHLSQLGAFGLCVGNQSEALRLREVGISCPLLCLGPYTDKEVEKAAAKSISLAVTRHDQAEMINRIGRRQGVKVRVHLKIDTGLGRVGVPWKQAFASLHVLNTMEYISLEGIYTSLTEDPEVDERQLSIFEDICLKAEKEDLSTGHRHVASSAFLLHCKKVPFDLVRPGIMLIGCYPSRFEYQRKRIKLKQCLAWKARISGIKELARGEGVCYHHTYRAQQDEIILIAAVGYSDGYPVNAAANGFVLVNGKRLPLVASVTANHIFIKADKNIRVQAGDEVILVGGQDNEKISLEELASWTDQSEYQLASSISPLLPRFYRSSSQDAPPSLR